MFGGRLQNPNRTKRLFQQLQNASGYSGPEERGRKREAERGSNGRDEAPSPCPTIDEPGYKLFVSNLQKQKIALPAPSNQSKIVAKQQRPTALHLSHQRQDHLGNPETHKTLPKSQNISTEDVERWIENTLLHTNQTQENGHGLLGRQHPVTLNLESPHSSKSPLRQHQTPLENTKELESGTQDPVPDLDQSLKPKGDDNKLQVTSNLEASNSPQSPLSQHDTQIENTKEMEWGIEDAVHDFLDPSSELSDDDILLPVTPSLDASHSPKSPLNHDNPALERGTEDSAGSSSQTLKLQDADIPLPATPNFDVLHTPRKSSQQSPMPNSNVPESGPNEITSTANQDTGRKSNAMSHVVNQPSVPPETNVGSFPVPEPSTPIVISEQPGSALFSDSSNSTIIFSISDDGSLVPVVSSPTGPDSPLAQHLISSSPLLGATATPTPSQTGSTTEETDAQQARRSLFPEDANNLKRKRQNQEPTEPRARKRQSYPSTWKANVAKAARHAGKEYTSKTGKVFPKKQLGPPCKKDCKFNCSERITHEDRQVVFDKFYESHTQEKKWDFISRLLFLEKPVRPSAETITGTNRSTSIQYNLRVEGKFVRVCKTLFLSTLQISEQVVKTVVKKLGSSCGTSPDKRGSNKPGNRIPGEITQSIKDHINSFPRVASHFCRADSTCEYLEEEVGSVANMFRLYGLWAEENAVSKPATYRQYLDVFNNTPGLNIRFFKPKKDQCDYCFAYGQKTAEEKEEAKAEYEEHMRRKEVPQSLKREDRLEARTSSEFCAAVFDLQKVLFTPKCESGLLYYHRKFSNYNFTVWDLGKKEGHCYCWNEVTGKRGSNEIASFVLNFIEKKVTSGIKRFHFYADNCAGQNKNRMIYAMLMHAAAKFEVDIVLRFLMTGHTMNEGDSMHACIENHATNTNMFVSEDWWQSIQTAKKDGKPFIVNKVTQEDIFDFHDFVHSKSEWKHNVSGKEVSWSKLEELQFLGDKPGIIRYKVNMDCDEDMIGEVDTKLKRKGHPVNLRTFKFPQAYRAILPISIKKKEDLVMYCDRGIIPTKDQDFYRSLKATKTVSERDDFYCQKLRGQKQ